MNLYEVDIKGETWQTQSENMDKALQQLKSASRVHIKKSEVFQLQEIPCPACKGNGVYNPGMGLDPDWCGNCGGVGIDWKRINEIS